MRENSCGCFIGTCAINLHLSTFEFRPYQLFHNGRQNQVGRLWQFWKSAQAGVIGVLNQADDQDGQECKQKARKRDEERGTEVS